MGIAWGYGRDFIVIEQDNPPVRVAVSVQDFDGIVKDYIANRREGFVAQKLIEGALFDDDMSSGL